MALTTVGPLRLERVSVKTMQPTKLRILSMISNLTDLSMNIAIGGGDIRAIEVLKKWHSWNVDVKTLETNPSPSRLMNANYNIHSFSLPFKGYQTVAIFLNVLVLLLKQLWISFSMRGKFDAVIAFNSSFVNVAPAWLFSRLYRKPLFIGFQISSYAPSYWANYRVKRQEEERVIHSLWLALSAWATLKLARSAAAIFCLSQPIAEMLKGFGFAERRLYVNGMGVNLDLIESIPHKEKEFDAVFLGRVEKNKGVKEILDSWGIVVKQRPQAKLLIVGAGDFLKEARRHVGKTGLDTNVKFTGFIASDEKYSCLKRSKVFLYPSKIKEGWGLSIAEALACGLPVVCSDNTVFRTIFGDCRSVLFTPIGDVKGLAQAILDLLDNETQMTSYGKTSKDYVRQFEWDSIARRELEITKSYLQKNFHKWSL